MMQSNCNEEPINRPDRVPGLQTQFMTERAKRTETRRSLPASLERGSSTVSSPNCNKLPPLAPAALSQHRTSLPPSPRFPKVSPPTRPALTLHRLSCLLCYPTKACPAPG